MTWDICPFTNKASDNFGLEIKPEKFKKSLADYDTIIIPGGLGTRRLQYEMEFINWIKTSEDVKFEISICTGSLILGAVGFLNPKKATTNWWEYETLRPSCKKVVTDRIVDDHNVLLPAQLSFQ